MQVSEVCTFSIEKMEPTEQVSACPARRLFDFTCAVVGLLLLSPLFAVTALAIKLEDGGPVLFVQPRVGRNFQLFQLYKFRSMVPDAERLGTALTRPNDARVTCVGAFLRRHKLDELPQLLNVLKGDMQLVGPRPEIAKYVEKFHDQYALLLRDRPGITDPASLVYRQEERFFAGEEIEGQYIAHVLPHKIELALHYARRRTFFSDLCIIRRTLLGG